MSHLMLWPTNHAWHASSTIHSPPSRNCSLKYTSALAASTNNEAETSWNNVIICILLIWGINVNPHTPSVSLALALCCSRLSVSQEKRVAAQMSAADWSTQLTLSANHKRPRSAWLANTPETVSASFPVLRPAVTLRNDPRSRPMTGQNWLRVSFQDNSTAEQREGRLSEMFHSETCTRKRVILQMRGFVSL